MKQSIFQCTFLTILLLEITQFILFLFEFRKALIDLVKGLVDGGKLVVGFAHDLLRFFFLCNKLLCSRHALQDVESL